MLNTHEQCMTDRPAGKAAAVVVAGGQGVRFAADRPKQFIEILGKSVVAHALERLARLHDLDSFVLVVPDTFRELGETICQAALPERIYWAITVAGDSRFHSVYNGLAALAGLIQTEEITAPDCVLIHDAARPCVSREDVTAVLAATRRTGAAVLATPVTSTLKAVRESRQDGLYVDHTVRRDALYQAQTPQGIRWPTAWDIYQKAFADSNAADAITDDAQLVEYYGYPVEVVVGSPFNIKITVPGDRVIAEAFLKFEPS